MSIRIYKKHEWITPITDVLTSHERFLKEGKSFYQKGRNTLRVFDCNGRSVVVKSFDKMSLGSRIIYGLFGNSKARKAHIYAERLLAKGIDTPESVAYVDIRHHGKLTHSYSVTMMSDYKSAGGDFWLYLNKTLNTQETNSFLKELSKFLLCTHKQGVVHGDLNRDNILFHRYNNGTYVFQLIDINRMSFHRKLSLFRRIWDMCRLGNDEVSKELFNHYASLINPDITRLVTIRTNIRKIYDIKRNIKIFLGLKHK